MKIQAGAHPSSSDDETIKPFTDCSLYRGPMSVSTCDERREGSGSSQPCSINPGSQERFSLVDLSIYFFSMNLTKRLKLQYYESKSVSNP